MENVSCDYCCFDDYNIICKQKDIVHKTSEDYFQIVRCKNCGLNYTNPRPNKKLISKYYPKEYRFYRTSKFNSLKELILNFLSNSLFGNLFVIIPTVYRKLKNHVKPNILYPITIKKNESILDIGCGSGISTHFWGHKESLKNYLNLSKNIYGVEPNISSQKILEKMNISVFSDISEIKDTLKFDFIRMNWSLEHVHEPSKYFKFIFNHLKNNESKALICIPNYEGHIYKIDKSNVELPIHLYHFKYNDIVNYCNKFKLKINLFQTFSYATMYYFSASVNQKLNKYKNMSLYSMQKLQKELDEISKKNQGNDMIFLIKKNV
tara:strand:+ start:106 stop:1068 length:963 start_codon:yes stop_codon:yes gene_type:complete